MPMRGAIPVLTRALRREEVHRSVGLLAGATLLALRLVAEGRVRRAETGEAWRIGGLSPGEEESVRRLALARGGAGSDPAAVETLVRSVLDAVADAVTSRPVGAGWREPEDDDPAGPDQVTVSLRVEAPEEQLEVGSLSLVVQAHDVEDPSHVVDAADLGGAGRVSLLAGLREAAAAWPMLEPLLAERVPDRLELEADQVASLLEHGVPALRSVGVDVFWPKALRAEITPRARVVSRQEAPLQTGLFGPDALFAFDWRLAVRGPDQDASAVDLTDEEMAALVASATPIVRLRDSWVVVDPALARQARRRITSAPSTDVTPAAAVRAALTGVVEVDGEEVEVHPGASLLRLQERVAGVTSTSPLPQPAGLAGTLRDYQRRGFTWLAELTGMGLGGCLADDMGLGKTLTLIALHLHRRERGLAAGPTLVVCPTSLLGNWEAEVRRFAPGEEVRRFHGSRRELSGSDGFVLTTYGTMRRDAATLAAHPWDLVVADEAQHVKNAKASVAKQLRTIGSSCRVALTGTPVENDLSELWAILDWVVPGLLGSRAAFRKVWAAPIEAGVDPEVTRRFAALVEPFLLRRRKSDPGIAPELPAKTETDDIVGMTREQVVLYQTLVRDSMEQIERADPETRRGLVLAMLTGLKQICNHPAHYLHQAAGRLPGRSAKLELLEELVATILAEGGSVLVFTQYVAMARLLERRLAELGVGTLLLHGGLAAGERERMVDAFQAGLAPVFLLSLKAGGTGLNLTRADHVIHVDRWWNPAVEDQATDRAHRIGQTRPVQVHRLVTEGTIEQRVGQLLVRKRELAEAVLGRGAEPALTELSDAELRDLVTLTSGGPGTSDSPGDA
ncbi:DEAD/DEAH box helicase [Nocardioides mangrovicus]|uniref:DEAD/DEAH box helicase n=2 Tax=Nocardioides mangrovicus TaxID=2478913 RepID=A0A3L8P1X4_9ACTN|nr:DEAD/DEAH box helicase [Nocardioides mangrovicus]